MERKLEAVSFWMTGVNSTNFHVQVESELYIKKERKSHIKVTPVVIVICSLGVNERFSIKNAN